MAKTTNKSINLIAFTTIELKIENIQLLMEFRMTPKKKKEISEKLSDLHKSLVELKNIIYP